MIFFKSVELAPRPRHGADVQPEAILVKNIIVEMHKSMSVLTDLVRYLRSDLQFPFVHVVWSLSNTGKYTTYT